MIYLSEKEIKLLENIYCYRNMFELTKNSINDNELEIYKSDIENMKHSIDEWYYDNASFHICKISTSYNNFYFFNKSYAYEYSEYKELLNKIFTNNKIDYVSDFKTLKKEILLKSKYKNNNIDEEEMEFLKYYVECFDSADELVEKYHSEEDLEEYISHYDNLENLFVNWFINNRSKVRKIKKPNGTVLYFYINSDDISVTEQRIKIYESIDKIVFIKDINNETEYKNKILGLGN